MSQIEITHVGSMPRGAELTPLLRARDAGEPAIAYQVLIYPVVSKDTAFQTASRDRGGLFSGESRGRRCART